MKTQTREEFVIAFVAEVARQQFGRVDEMLFAQQRVWRETLYAYAEKLWDNAHRNQETPTSK